MNNWFSVEPEKMAKLAFALGVGEFGLRCAQNAYRMWQGGNQWSGWVAYLSFFRYIAKLAIDYSKYDHWEKLCEHSGPRIMHPDFCMISDRPEVLIVDERNRPHCTTGPFCKWRDGAALYALNGTYVPMWAIEMPKDQIDPKQVLAITNTEVRTAIMKHVGLGKFLAALNAELLDERLDGLKLYYLTIDGNKIGPYLFLTCPSTGREFLEGVGDAEKYEFIDPTIKTCDDAERWRIEKASNGNVTEIPRPEERIYHA